MVEQVAQSANALWFGFLAGFIASVPGGPVNVTILNEGAIRGFRWALFIGIGAVAMETIYCTIACAGFFNLFDSRTLHATIELVSFLLMLWLGIKYLRGGPLPGEQRGIEIVEHRFHPHAAFWIGFARVLGNPGILLLWITVVASFLSHAWLPNDWRSKGSFIGGVALGGLSWFFLLSWGVSQGHGRFSASTLRKMSQASGLFLLAAAALIGTRLVLLLRRHLP